MKKRSGFTLAEVLITLGIIGVVAAMTIPTLIQNTNGVKFLSQFKKSVSTLSQAGLMAMANHDVDYSTLSTASNTTNCGTEVLPGNVTICGLFNSTLSGQQFLGTYGTVQDGNGNNYTITAKALSPNANYVLFSLADGSMVGVNKDAVGCTLAAGGLSSTALANAVTSSGGTVTTSAGDLNKCLGFIDVNGVQAPNKEVECSSGTTTFGNSTCALTSGANIGDVYPVLFHDGTVEPATNAARAALINQKKQ